MRNLQNNPTWRHLCCTLPAAAVALLVGLALVGMIARNSAMLIDQIEHERAKGRDAWAAVVDATLHRFCPILLTAAAAILAIILIAPTSFWGPMAYANTPGLAVATVLTFIFLPALYMIWFRVGTLRQQRHAASQETCPWIPLPS
jgi:multidrug efflux pump subunit AcrB